jgi:hypothetical protein
MRKREAGIKKQILQNKKTERLAQKPDRAGAEKEKTDSHLGKENPARQRKKRKKEY